MFGIVITFPDAGMAQSINVAITLDNSDLDSLRVALVDPNLTEYVLWCGANVLTFPGDNCSQTSAATTIDTSYPTPTAPFIGDLNTWLGSNPTGNWTIKVYDTGIGTGSNDGAVSAFCVTVNAVSN